MSQEPLDVETHETVASRRRDSSTSRSGASDGDRPVVARTILRLFRADRVTLTLRIPLMLMIISGRRLERLVASAIARLGARQQPACVGANEASFVRLVARKISGTWHGTLVMLKCRFDWPRDHEAKDGPERSRVVWFEAKPKRRTDYWRTGPNADSGRYADYT